MQMTVFNYWEIGGKVSLRTKDKRLVKKCVSGATLARNLDQ